jgi:hypothetical protein
MLSLIANAGTQYCSTFSAERYLKTEYSFQVLVINAGKLLLGQEHCLVYSH